MNFKYQQSNKRYLGLRISFGNIIGLSNEKSENDIYHQYINKFNIIFLSDTWKRKIHKEVTTLVMVGYFHENMYKKTKKVWYQGVFEFVIGKD